MQINSFMDAAVLEMYSWTQDGTQYVGISADGTNWQKTKALENPGASSVQALDPSQMGEMLNSYLDSLENFVIEGEEQIEGKDAYKITGKISAEEIKNMMSSVSQGMDIPLSGEIPISIWIGKKDGCPCNITSIWPASPIPRRGGHGGERRIGEGIFHDNHNSRIWDCRF